MSWSHLNLADGDCVKGSSAIDVVREMSKLIKKSKRDRNLEQVKEILIPDSPGLSVFCYSSWTVRTTQPSKRRCSVMLPCKTYRTTVFVL